jgi:hypothetical protein
VCEAPEERLNLDAEFDETSSSGKPYEKQRTVDFKDLGVDWSD